MPSGARGDDRLEHGLGTFPTTRAIRGFSVNADLCGRRRARGRPSLSCRFYSRPRSRSRILREGSRTSKRPRGDMSLEAGRRVVARGVVERDGKGPERTGCYEAAAHAAICATYPASGIARSRRVPRKFRQTRVPTARLARRASVASTPNAAVETAGCRRSLGIPSRKPDGGLPRLEAPLVDLQRLDLRLQRRGGHPEPPRGAERPGHAALAVLERRLDGVLFVGRPRAGGEAGDRRGPKGSTGEPPRIDRERVRITHDHRALDDVLQLADVPWPVVRLKQLRRLLGEAADPLADARSVAMGEVFDEQGDIRPTFAQGGHVQGEHVEPIEEVRA